MRQAENVISIPVRQWSTGLIREISSGETNRLEAVASRLENLENLLGFIVNIDEVPPAIAALFQTVNYQVQSIRQIAEGVQ